MFKLSPLLLLLLALQNGLSAQVIPNASLSKLDGTNFQAENLNQITSKPVVLSFWATWCIPCINELSAINENMDDWRKEAKFEFYAISQDDSRTAKTVPALVSGKGWQFNVLLDKNQELKRGLNLLNIPYTIILKDGKIIYRKAGYVAGNEQEIFEVIKANQ